MIPILSQKQSLEFDKHTVESDFVSESVLMDNAGKKIAQFILEKIRDPFKSRITIVSGPGNNGSDGIICYYYLLKYGINSQLLLCNESLIESKLIDLYGLNIDEIQIYSDLYKFDNGDWHIDAIFGIGLSRSVSGIYYEIINKMNKLDKVLSIDLPSGIYCDSGKSAKISINPTITLGLGYPKRCYFFNDGLNKINNLNILDIGFSEYINDDVIRLIEAKDVRKIIPKHGNDVHKYKRGKVLIIAGSIGYTGACILSSLAAISAGAGIIKVMSPLSLKNQYESNLIEPIIKYVDDNGSGKFNISHIEAIKKEIFWADSILFGPGLSNDENDIEFKFELLKLINKPLVIDASGFQPLISGEMNIKDLPEKCILTPHYKEFSKLFNMNIDKLSDDPVEAIDIIKEKLSGRVLVLKGPTTIIIDSNERKYFLSHGNNQLSVAGTGDVLSGVCVSSLAQGLTVNKSAIYSSFLHSECILQYNRRISNSGLIASDLIKMLPYAMDALSELS